MPFYWLKMPFSPFPLGTPRLSSNTTISKKPALTLDPQAQAQVISLGASGLAFVAGPVVPFRAPPLQDGEPLYGRA